MQCFANRGWGKTNMRTLHFSARSALIHKKTSRLLYVKKFSKPYQVSKFHFTSAVALHIAACSHSALVHTDAVQEMQQFLHCIAITLWNAACLPELDCMGASSHAIQFQCKQKRPPEPFLFFFKKRMQCEESHLKWMNEGAKHMRRAVWTRATSPKNTRSFNWQVAKRAALWDRLVKTVDLHI